jgi:hypothetical protein
MKLVEMIELVQQHHPHMGETEIVKLLNRAKDDFCERSEIVKSTWVDQTVANQRYYPVEHQVIKITEVYLNDTRIPRLLEKLPIDDDTSEIA